MIMTKKIDTQVKYTIASSDGNAFHCIASELEIMTLLNIH